MLRLWLAAAGLLVAQTGCEHAGLPDASAPDAAGLRRLDSFRSHRGLTGRSVLRCPAGDCVVLHYPCRPAPAMEATAAILQGDSGMADDDGQICQPAEDAWLGPADNVQHVWSTFNCCTFAVGDVAGLSSADWVAPNATGDTLNTAPMQVILDSYFQQLQVHRAPIANWAKIERDETLQEGDVLCLVDTSAALPEFVHAGKIRKLQGRNCLVSKLGSGPIVRATIASTARQFPDFHEVRLYRRQS